MVAGVGEWCTLTVSGGLKDGAVEDDNDEDDDNDHGLY